jgi:phosphohistidine phosphatase SixA
MKKLLILFLSLSLCVGFLACQEEGPVLPDELRVSSSRPSAVLPGSIILFTANASVEWLVVDENGGEIDANGRYVAPSTPGVYAIRAVSTEDPSVSTGVRVYVTNLAEQFNRLQTGGYVLYFRHAEANVGRDAFRPSGNWHLTCDADSARQLSEMGLQDALFTGKVLKALEIPFDTAYSSEFCRCFRTLNRFFLEDLEYSLEPAITYYVYDESMRHQRTLELISAQSVGRGVNVLMVSHSFGPGSTFPQLNQGDAAIFKPVAGSEPEYIGAIPRDAWVELYRE